MRAPPIASPRLVLAAAFAASIAVAGPARAGDDEPFDVHVARGEVTVVAHGDWHINKDFPWKLVVGGKKLDRSRFDLGDKTATVRDAPAGKGTLRGAVCSKETCRTLERELTIP